MRRLAPTRGGVAAGVLAAVLLVSCSSLPTTELLPPMIEGATFVGNAACVECHTNISRVFPSNPHARIHLAGASSSEPTGCESCHGAGSRHIAGGGGRGKFILNPGREPAPCLNCHLETQLQFRLPQHHPVLEGKLTCTQCHEPHGADAQKPGRGLAMARLNEQCATCHREQTRPFLFEHEALREGCVTCHEPHGSINAKMLTERDANLCLKCHAQNPGPGVASGRIYLGQTDHTDRLRLGTCWSAGCHTAIHGSNVHPRHLY